MSDAKNIGPAVHTNWFDPTIPQVWFDPKIMYKADGTSVSVGSQVEQDAAAAEGYTTDPPDVVLTLEERVAALEAAVPPEGGALEYEKEERARIAKLPADQRSAAEVKLTKELARRRLVEKPKVAATPVAQEPTPPPHQ